MEEVKQRMAEALKGMKFDNCFDQWKKCLYRCTAQKKDDGS